VDAVVTPRIETDAVRGTAGRIALLDGYRALAIVAVLAFHYTVRWAPPYDKAAHLPAGAVFNDVLPLRYGWLGVELFFVISGFVILMTLERSSSIADFASRRFARLWPPLIVGASLTTLVVFLIGPADWHVNAQSFITSILLIDPWLSSKLTHVHGMRWVDGAYWSLWVEIRFYALAAVFYLLARGKFIAWWIVWQVLVFGVWLAAHYAHANEQWLSLFCFPEHLAYFTFGACLYEIHAKGSANTTAVAGAGLAAAIILASAALGMGSHGFEDKRLILAGNLGILCLFLLFLRDHPLVSVFKLKPVVVLGQASYSLYLIHQLIGVSVMRQLVDLGAPYLVVLPLTAGGMIAIAVVLFRTVEDPAKRWVLARSRNPVSALETRALWLRLERKRSRFVLDRTE
jgi:peptidoglycan/LPS O-acetylase OafA/YrhL